MERFLAGAGVARRGRVAGVDFGVLAPLVADPRVTDVFVNGGGPVWVDRGGGLVRTSVAVSEPQARDLAVRLVAAGGRHVDEASPLVDTRLSDGIRVHAVLAPVSPVGTLVSVRLPAPRPPTLADLERSGFFDLVPLADVLPLVRDRVNLLVTGAAGSGKTTLLAALLSRASPSERIVAIEDVAELRVRHPHFVPLEVRQANLEGAGSIDLARLLREALRMRPDRLVLGECRGAEVRDLLSALNTGHDGGAGTLHANSIADVPVRLEALGALAGMSPSTIARQAASAIGAVLHVERVVNERAPTESGSVVRRLARLGRLELVDDRLVVVES